MDYTLFNIVALGLVAVMCGLLLLLSMVHLELGPAVRLERYKRWLLVVALGSGIVAFSVKIILVLVLSYFPHYFIKPLLESKESDPVAAPSKTKKIPRYLWVPISEKTSENRGASTLRVSPRYVWEALPEKAPSPVGNPTTPGKVALGKKLFFDPMLSRDGSVSCASCHDVFGKAGADGRATSVGINNQTGFRNAPTVWNAAFQSELFWDGRASSLEEQAKGPLVNPLEMDMPSLVMVEDRVAQKQEYREAFAGVYGDEVPITIDRITEAIAAYERTLITPDTPYDRFIRGDRDALTQAQLRGMNLFQSFGCINCHYGPNFSAASVFDSTAPRRIFPVNPTPFEKRYLLLVGDGERGTWRVPSLRNVALTGPWLHNGSISKLEEVVRVMAAAQLGRAGHYLLWSQSEGTLREMNSPAPSEREVADIVAFLHALSSERLIGGDDAVLKH